MNLIIGLVAVSIAMVLIIVIAALIAHAARRRRIQPRTALRYETIRRDTTYSPLTAHELFKLYPYLENPKNRARMQGYAQRIAAGEALYPSEISDLKRLVQLARRNHGSRPGARTSRSR